MEIKKENKNENLLLYKFIFEEYGDDSGGDGYSGLSSYGGGASTGGVSIFKQTFIDPFFDIFRSGQYAVEKTGNALFFFAKKLAVNFPRLFSPTKPLIFSEIRDQEVAAIKRMDKRYAEVIEKNAKALENKDAKLMLFLLNPKAVLSYKFAKSSPKAAWEIANTVSGNRLQDLVTNIKQAYNALPAVQRKNLRVQQYIQKYKVDDEKNKKTSLKSTVPDGESYINNYSYGSQGTQFDLDENNLENSAAGNQAPTENDFFEAAMLFLDNNPSEKEKIFGDGVQQIKSAGNELINSMVKKFEKVKAAKTLEEYSSASGADINKAKQELNSIINTELQKEKDPKVKNEISSNFQKIKAQIEPQLLASLKNDYMQNVKQILEPLYGSLSPDEKNNISRLFTK